MSGPDRLGRFAVRDLPDGRVAYLTRMIFTWRLCVSDPDDFCGYDDGWCYKDFAVALEALKQWDGTGEPQGWHRHPGSGRRRPDGDSGREYQLA